MDVVEKLIELIENKGVTAYEISKDTGIDQSVLSRLLSGKTKKPQIETQKILVKYLQGTLNELKEINATNIINIPIVSQYAYAGYLSSFADPEFIENLPTIPFVADHDPRGIYRAFEVRGDSMDNGEDEAIKQGDVLICRNILQQHWKDKLHINQWDFVLVHKEDGILCKRILKHDAVTGEIIIHSLNSMYEDRTCNISEFAEIYNIIQVVKKRKRK